MRERKRRRNEAKQLKLDIKKEVKDRLAAYNKVADEAGLNDTERLIFVESCVRKGVKPEDLLDGKEKNEDQGRTSGK